MADRPSIVPVGILPHRRPAQKPARAGVQSAAESVLRQSRQPRRFFAGVDFPAAPLAAFDASRCRFGLLADQQTQTLHHPKCLQRTLDSAPQRQPAVDYRADESRAPSGRFADYLPRRYTQYGRKRNPAPFQIRHLSSGEEQTGYRVCADMDRQHQPRPAQRQSAARAAVVRSPHRRTADPARR